MIKILDHWFKGTALHTTEFLLFKDEKNKIGCISKCEHKKGSVDYAISYSPNERLVKDSDEKTWNKIYNVWKGIENGN